MENNIKSNIHLQRYMTQDYVFSEQECQDVINYAENNNAKADVIYDKYYVTNTKIIPVEDQEMNNIITKKLSQYIEKINSNYYNFKITELKELQIIKVSENGFSNLQYDIGKGIKSTRKLSIVVYLSNMDDYSGGQITFSMVEPKIDQCIQKQGTMLLFPSIKPYSSEPVLKGTRYTLVGWMHGEPFV